MRWATRAVHNSAVCCRAAHAAQRCAALPYAVRRGRRHGMLCCAAPSAVLQCSPPHAHMPARRLPAEPHLVALLLPLAVELLAAHVCAVRQHLGVLVVDLRAGGQVGRSQGAVCVCRAAWTAAAAEAAAATRQLRSAQPRGRRGEPRGRTRPDTSGHYTLTAAHTCGREHMLLRRGTPSHPPSPPPSHCAAQSSKSPARPRAPRRAPQPPPPCPQLHTNAKRSRAEGRRR